MENASIMLSKYLASIINESLDIGESTEKMMEWTDTDDEARALAQSYCAKEKPEARTRAYKNELATRLSAYHIKDNMQRRSRKGKSFYAQPI